MSPAVPRPPFTAVLLVLLAALVLVGIVAIGIGTVSIPPLRVVGLLIDCLLYTSPSPRDRTRSRMPSSA